MNSEAKEILQKIKENLSNALPTEALDAFNGTKFENEAIGLKGKLKNIEAKRERGLVDFNQYNIVYNNIVESIVSLTNTFEEDLNNKENLNITIESIGSFIQNIEENSSNLSESLDLGPIIDDFNSAREERFFEQAAGAYLQRLRSSYNSKMTSYEEELVENTISRYPEWIYNNKTLLIESLSMLLDLVQNSLLNAETADRDRFYEIKNEIEPIFDSFFRNLFSDLSIQTAKIEQSRLPNGSKTKLLEWFNALENAF